MAELQGDLIMQTAYGTLFFFIYHKDCSLMQNVSPDSGFDPVPN